MPKTGSGLPTGSFKSTPSGVFNFAVLVFLAWSGLYWAVGGAHRPEDGLKTLGKLKVEQSVWKAVLHVSDAKLNATGRDFCQIWCDWQNLGAVGWSLTPEQVAKVDAASAIPAVYPYWHQRAAFAERNPFPTNLG